MGRNNNIGSVSHATMRAEDLIPRFISELQSQKPLHRAHRKLIRQIERDMKHSDYWTQDSDGYGACYDLDDLFNALNDYAPTYFYFGAHPGDGSDYGYWLDESFIDDFDGLRVNDLSEVPTGYTGEVLLVNDHGNCSLYAYSRGRRRELWAIV